MTRTTTYFPIICELLSAMNSAVRPYNLNKTHYRIRDSVARDTQGLVIKQYIHEKNTETALVTYHENISIK